MKIEIKVPDLGESIAEVEVAAWSKKVEEWVDLDEGLVEIESEKATVEVPAPAAGVLATISKETGTVVKIGEVLGKIDTEAQPTVAASKNAPAPTPSKEASKPIVMPAAQRMLAEKDMSASQVSGTGPGGRILKEDVAGAAPPGMEPTVHSRDERRERMSPIRRTIGSRLLEAQATAALLTTFNEVDMTRVKALRKEVGEEFLARHGAKLGFMSFFVKAAVESLKLFPAVNGRIDGNEIVYREYYDVGIAVGGGKGLVVPVIHDADRLSFAQIEQTIALKGERARNGTLTPEELEGGTFTISNGGIYGSMLSTPIVNPPQSGILGLHAIKDRAVVVDGQVVVRPIMYVALTYDHRLVDGREAVTFLKGIKERMENPARLLLEV